MKKENKNKNICFTFNTPSRFIYQRNKCEKIRPHLYGLGYPRQPSIPGTLYRAFIRLKRLSLPAESKLTLVWASSYESGWLGWLGCRYEFCRRFIREILARLNDMKFDKQNKLAQQRCILRNYRSFVDSCDLTDKGKSQTSEVEIHTGKNYAISAALLRKRSYFVKNVSSR